MTRNPILEKFLYNFLLVSDGMNYINKNYYELLQEEYFKFQEYIFVYRDDFLNDLFIKYNFDMERKNVFFMFE